MQLIRSLDIQQPDFQWQYQLRHERDITAQLEAVWALERYASPGSKKALVDIIEEEKCFYKVRGAACHSLTKVCNAMATTSEGPPALLVIFKKMYGSFANSSICKQNDFSNLQSYFLQKEIPVAMAGKITFDVLASGVAFSVTDCFSRFEKFPQYLPTRSAQVFVGFVQVQ